MVSSERSSEESRAEMLLFCQHSPLWTSQNANFRLDSNGNITFPKKSEGKPFCASKANRILQHRYLTALVKTLPRQKRLGQDQKHMCIQIGTDQILSWAAEKGLRRRDDCTECNLTTIFTAPPSQPLEPGVVIIQEDFRAIKPDALQPSRHHAFWMYTCCYNDIRDIPQFHLFMAASPNTVDAGMATYAGVYGAHEPDPIKGAHPDEDPDSRAMVFENLGYDFRVPLDLAEEGKTIIIDEFHARVLCSRSSKPIVDDSGVAFKNEGSSRKELFLCSEKVSPALLMSTNKAADLQKLRDARLEEWETARRLTREAWASVLSAKRKSMDQESPREKKRGRGRLSAPDESPSTAAGISARPVHPVTPRTQVQRRNGRQHNQSQVCESMVVVIDDD